MSDSIEVVNSTHCTICNKFLTSINTYFYTEEGEIRPRYLNVNGYIDEPLCIKCLHKIEEEETDGSDLY